MCSKEQLFERNDLQAVLPTGYGKAEFYLTTKPHGVMNWMRVCEQANNRLDIYLQVRFLSDTFQAPIVSF